MDINKLFDDLYEKVKDYDIIMIHSDISYLIYNFDETQIKQKFFEYFKRLVDSNKTIIIPTFNWGFCQGKEYHYINSKSQVGILSKWCLESELFERTNDPVYSCAIYGPNKDIFLDCEYSTAFGKNSVFDKVNSLNSIVILINNQHLSIVHYYEELKKVPYRYIKKFISSVNFNNSEENYEYDMFVRKLESNVNLSIDQYGHKSFLNKYIGSIIDRVIYNKDFYIDFIPMDKFGIAINNDLDLDINMLIKSNNFIYNIRDDNLVNFSKCSFDFNPNHTSELFASKTIFGKRVVYGIYLFMLAFNNFQTLKKLKFKKINCTFLKAVLIDENINIKYDNNVILIYRNNDIVSKIEFEIEETIHDSIDIKIDEFNISNSIYKLNNGDINTINNSYEESIYIEYNKYFFDKCFSKIFNKFDRYQIIQILNFSKLVGMNSPGENALFLSFNINFNTIEANKDFLNYKVVSKDYNINLLTYSVIGHNLSGEIMSFCKKDIRYKNINDIKIDENLLFANKNVLILGGSNGIGEAVTKIMYKCKANINSTYFGSKNNMEKIKKECNDDINIFQFNILTDIDNIEKMKKLKELNITHLFYFATPRILLDKDNNFDLLKMNTYYEFYIANFVKLTDALAETLEYVFYPSTIFIEDEKLKNDSYSIIKKLAEDIIYKLNGKYKNINFINKRLPKLLTEQNNFYHNNLDDIYDPVTYMIDLLKLKKQKDNIYLLSYKNIDFINKELENTFKYNNYQVLSSEYNQIEQDIINKESNLYKNNPKFIFLINRIEDILKVEFIDIYYKEYDSIFENYLDLVKNLRKNTSSTIYINSFHHSFIPITQNYTGNNTSEFLINKYNEELYKLGEELSDVIIINSNIFSNDNKIDMKSYFIGNYIYSYDYSKKLANYIHGLIMNKLGKSIRLIVLDLDNTLWGGVVGEDGVHGIKLGETYPGNCFTYFQKVLKSLTKFGIALAICSKNDEKIVKEVFNERNDMILKYDDFICKKINWTNKSENILNISKEVGLGLSNILFIDDNPIERAEVKTILPDINILEIDIQAPEDYTTILLDNNKMVINKILEEDMKRNDKYKQNLEFNNIKTSFNDIKEFYKSLNSKVYLNKLSEKNIDRCESLINKTNQFNFTTIRLSRNQIIDMNETNFEFYVIGYENNFFEYENIGVLIFDKINNEIYNYLLSCRVIGKGIEEDILIYFINSLKEKGIKKIYGKIIPTDRNLPVRNIYENIGFTKKKDVYFLDICDFKMKLVNSDVCVDGEQSNKSITKINNNISNDNKLNTDTKKTQELNEDKLKELYNILSEITKYKPSVEEKIEIYQDWDSLKTILFIKKVESKFDIKIKEINYFSLTLKQIINMI